MQLVIQEFEQRVTEVDCYFKLLKQLEDPDVQLCRPVANGRRRWPPDDTSLKVMKASAFLLVYNLVEAGIRSALERLYEQILQEGRSFGDLREDIRRLWIKQEHGALDGYSASPRNYHELAERIATEIVNSATIQLLADRLPVAGNLDADNIRKLCRQHGIPVAVHYRALGGGELVTVRQQRNLLAHGHVAFSQCGQQYAVTDLERIKKQAVVFVRSILRNIKKYVDGKRYVA